MTGAIKDKFSLFGRTALVTGGTMGIGAAVARALAEMGAGVIITGRSVELGDRLAAELSASGMQVSFLRQDVTDEAQWRSTVDVVEAEHGRLDILVNNAGILFYELAEQTAMEQYHRLQRVNVDGVFLGCKHAAPLMKKTATAECRGSIVNVSSIGGLLGMKFLSSYCASKGAVRMMTKAMAAELGEHHIRVNSLHPGIIETGMGTQVKQMFGEALHVDEAGADAAVSSLNPLQSTGQPEDVAAAVVYLASAASNFVTGAELVVDGGTTCCR
jgi:NAD(P)-dependent dehydrogenase (short-subunit alcohol dehydrogenase family)